MRVHVICYLQRMKPLHGKLDGMLEAVTSDIAELFVCLFWMGDVVYGVC